MVMAFSRARNTPHWPHGSKPPAHGSSSSRSRKSSAAQDGTGAELVMAGGWHTPSRWEAWDRHQESEKPQLLEEERPLWKKLRAATRAGAHLVDHMWQAPRTFVVPVPPFTSQAPTPAKCSLPTKPADSSVFPFSCQFWFEQSSGLSKVERLQIIREMLRLLIVLLLRVFCHRGRSWSFGQ